MDAVQLLEDDHKTVKALMNEYAAAPAGQPEQRRRLAERILQELMVHERIEEEIFYPAFRASMGKMGEEEVEHAKEEHELVDTLIEQLQQVDVDAPDFDATMRILQENVEHHIEDEEEKMLPAARRRMADQLDALGAEMMEYKKALLAELKARPRGTKRVRG